jgi:hypothetical protein
MNAKRLFAVAVAAASLALLGCAAQPETHATNAALTEDQRDSVIARSALPGAEVVGRARAESQRDARRAARLDALTR